SPDNSKIEPAKSVTDGNKLTGNNERVPVDRQARYAKADKGWNLSENGSFIEHVDKNGKTYQRYHSKHALEKMAPDTPEVRAVLERRAAEKGIPKYKVNGELNSDWVSATTPRDIPPSVVEDVIQTAKPVFNEEHGTWSYITDEIKLALDKPDGDVLTVFRRTRRNNGI
ncbi:MAG TPA: hypothetical protein VFF04_02205, partial [Candidatus Babeliales bacterium]|nr:hypothetical protein [Candidatus Babeliales bacterium]